MRTTSNSSNFINNVWLVDGLKHNLLSISQICDGGYEVLFDYNKCTIMRTPNKSIVSFGYKKCNVYHINFTDLADQKVVFLLPTSDEKWLWHKRLGHAIWKLIYKLIKLKLVKGLPYLKYHSDAICGTCQKGKIVKTSFKTKKIISTSIPLELLHIDLFGPVSTTSISFKKKVQPLSVGKSMHLL